MVVKGPVGKNGKDREIASCNRRSRPVISGKGMQIENLQAEKLSGREEEKNMKKSVIPAIDRF